MVRTLLIAVLIATTNPLGQAGENNDRYRKQCADIISAKGQTNNADRLWKLFDANWDYRMVASPESATWRGYPGQNDRWSDLSMQAIAEGKEDARLTLKAILSFDRARLSKADQLNYDLFRRNAEMAVER
ncbi:uncharacterized protein METZ01_LOCUS167079, partial [marine metagenome]